MRADFMKYTQIVILQSTFLCKIEKMETQWSLKLLQIDNPIFIAIYILYVYNRLQLQKNLNQYISLK